jgi:hypothetical protein
MKMSHRQTIIALPAHSGAAVYAAIARLRWPGYAVTGAGSVAVVLECSRRVLLVQTPLEAQALAAEKCCDICSHVAAPGANLHRIVEMEQPRQETPRRSMRRLPGWDD